MQKPTYGPVWRTLNWVIVPLYYPEYRKLVIRSLVLSARLELLCAVFTVVSPFATPGLLRMMRRWFEQLRTDVAEFGRVVRAPRTRARLRIEAPASAHTDSGGGFQNPWV